jgi:hypothetical protein
MLAAANNASESLLRTKRTLAATEATGASVLSVRLPLYCANDLPPWRVTYRFFYRLL